MQFVRVLYEKTYYRVKNRLLFIYKYKTIKSMKVINNNQICVSSSKGNFIISRRCPHQGAFLEKAFLMFEKGEP